jgi:hypothetical protein
MQLIVVVVAVAALLLCGGVDRVAAGMVPTSAVKTPQSTVEGTVQACRMNPPAVSGSFICICVLFFCSVLCGVCVLRSSPTPPSTVEETVQACHMNPTTVSFTFCLIICSLLDSCVCVLVLADALTLVLELPGRRS